MKPLFSILGIAAYGAIQVTLAAPYGVPASTVDAGGSHAASASYQHDGSVGGIAGVSTVAAPAETAKHGYIAQLYEVAGLQLAAFPTSVDEGSSRQFQAAHLLDDATTVAADAGAVAWSVASGPIESISASGLATAGTVYQNTSATIQGDLGNFTAMLGLTVLNVGKDDYQAYAADGIDDDWQVLYFGAPPNANAGPAVDPDGDGQKNLFEFLAGVIPNDSASRFLLHVEPVTGQPAQKRLVFSPRLADRTYTVETNGDLGAVWLPLSGATVSDNGSERSVTDPNAGASRKFYRVDITKP